MQQVSYGPLSCYTGFFNVRRGWQSLNTGPRFYLRLIRRTGWLWIYTSHTTDGRPFKPKKLSVPFLYPGVLAGLTPFRGLVPVGRRNLVPILPPAHPLGGWGYLIGMRLNDISFSLLLLFVFLCLKSNTCTLILEWYSIKILFSIRNWPY